MPDHSSEHLAHVTPPTMSDTEHMATGRVLSTEELAALRTKRVNVRCAHRVSATKSVNQIDAAIASDDALQPRQLKLSLADKLAVLTKLDDEILELTEESELEAEVEQADKARAKINLAIVTIEDAVSPRNVHSRKKRSRHREVGRTYDGFSSSDASEEERTDPSHTVTSDHHEATSTLPVLSVGTASISSAFVITTSPKTNHQCIPSARDTAPFHSIDEHDPSHSSHPAIRWVASACMV